MKRIRLHRSEVTNEELQKALASLKLNKSLGSDSIS